MFILHQGRNRMHPKYASSQAQSSQTCEGNTGTAGPL
ncbi:hypothetical protein FOPG_19487 [Fusarium oxysporum f. sp. conglutinans race 2 54008]|uniref:Uncharacterized protein n=1 Tax=Fusarium oxysporum f. sp. conglutinans race 2 54008 TaxID=1089457 RepID=X0GWF9_FUSOX|nr:hypothetical protein FOPG_19487 [Fusarium oxysporum f. sp. conglutinans race 2 54008]